MSVFRRILRLAAICFSAVAIAWVAVVLWHFPWAVDAPVIREEALKAYYTAAYEPENRVVKDTPLARAAKNAAETYRIRDRVAKFVSDYSLQHARILDVGSGRGYLQDVVADYRAGYLSDGCALLSQEVCSRDRDSHAIPGW
jgi:hypothetical protein